MNGEVLIYEKRVRWTPELQRQFAEADVRVRQFSRLSDLRKVAEESSRAVIVIDFAAGPAECLEFLGRSTGQPDFPPILVIGSERAAELEWSLREFGATAFLDEFTPGSQVARLIRRQWAQPSARGERRK